MASTRKRRPRRTLTPIRDQVHFPAFRSGRRELWSARSRDGLWTYERLEMTGTPWVVTFQPTGQDAWFGALNRARAWTAGSALADLARDAQRVIDADGYRGEMPPPSVEVRRQRVEQARRRLEILADPPTSWPV